MGGPIGLLVVTILEDLTLSAMYNLSYVRVALATSDVQSILDIPATDEIHMEDRNHGLA